MPNYWWTVLAFFVGLLAGFQGIHNRYPLQSLLLLWKTPSLLYLATRGALPSAAYCAILASGRVLPIPAGLLALSLGAGVELALRTRFFIRESTKADGTINEVLWGPFNLLKWYQDLFLKQLGVHVGDIKKECARTLVPANLSFVEVCDRIDDRLCLITDVAQRSDVGKTITKHRKDFVPGSDEERAKLRLVLALLNVVGKREMKQLVE